MKLEFVRIFDAGSCEWLSEAQSELDLLKNFIVVCSGPEPLFDLVGKDYKPEPLHKWGVYALNDVLQLEDLMWGVEQIKAGKEAFLIEQIKLPITRPPRVKELLVYCQARGIISQCSSLKEAKADLLRMIELYNRARVFPLVGVYQWGEGEWIQIKSLFGK